MTIAICVSMALNSRGGDEANRCEGDACQAISVVWDPAVSRYLIRNSSDCRVRVTLRAWPTSVEWTLAPNETRYLDQRSFDYPFFAVFDRQAD